MCPSCWTRRAADTAAQLVDRLLPLVPYRQWVLSFPWELRFLLAIDRAFLSRMLRVTLKTLFSWKKERGRSLGHADGHTGSVTFIQRFGSALNLNPHLHCLLPDGLFVPSRGGPLSFVPLPEPSQEELQTVLQRLVHRLGKVARARLEQAHSDESVDDEQQAVYNSAGEALRLPFGRSTCDSSWSELHTKPLCASLDGFSLHAARRIAAHDRDGLERLCRYGLRAPFSAQRFYQLPDNTVVYQLKRPWPGPGGRTELVFDPTALLRRLAALIPAPYLNLVRYHGVLHNRSRFRDQLPRPYDEPIEPGPNKPLDGAQTDSTSHPLLKRPRRLGWAQLLRRVLNVDALSCPSCAIPMLVIAFITEPTVIKRILDHLNIPSSLPAIAPAQLSPQVELDFSQTAHQSDTELTPDTLSHCHTRSPPEQPLS